MRDLADTLGNRIEPSSEERVDAVKNICRPFSISAVVVKGVKPGEPACLSAMYAMIGNAFTSIAVPYWAVGPTPGLSSSSDENSLWGISRKLKSYVFDSPANARLVNPAKISRLNPLLFEAEDHILDETDKLLEQWRNTSASPEGKPGHKGKPDTLVRQMLEAERSFAGYAYSKLAEFNARLNQAE
jgi:hypothetical protein